MIDISMQYLGMKLSGPIVVASTPLSESIDNVRHMEDAGASAIVLTSLFEEQLALESRALDEDLSRGTESFAESLGYLPDLDDYRMTQDVYLEHLRRAKAAVGREESYDIGLRSPLRPRPKIALRRAPPPLAFAHAPRLLRLAFRGRRRPRPDPD